MGYSRAGFEVFGVDLHPQKRYPFAFYQGDAIGALRTLLGGGEVDFRHRDGRVEVLGLEDFDGIHASPPCQGYTGMVAPGQIGAPRLIGAVWGMLDDAGKPYIIENVTGASSEMPGALTLCGSMFGLGAQGCQLQRHRLFVSNISLTAPLCDHDDRPVIGVYGGHARRRAASSGGRGTRDVWEGGHRAAMSEAMGIDWATCAEMSEAIPPAYTEWLGGEMIRHISTASPTDLANPPRPPIR